VGHTAQVMLRLQDIYYDFNESENAHSIHSLTGNRHEAEKSLKARARVVEKLDNLKVLVKGDPLQESNAAKLDSAIRFRFMMIQSQLEIQDQENFMVRSPAVNKVRNKIMDMMRIENMLMQERQEILRESSDKSTFAVVLALAMAILLILLASVIAMREYSAKADVEQQLLVNQGELKNKIQLLDETNKNLEQFAYMASHDLQEPLRKITTFSERINSKFSLELPAETQLYLDRISKAASRMRTLIDNLLRYSRITKSQLEKRMISLEMIINEIKDNCEVLIQNRGVVFSHNTALPEVIGDPTQLTLLFQNLISNAIKFTEPDVRPVLQISCATVTGGEVKELRPDARWEEYYVVALKDNGIGFDEEYLDKIFMTFYRLHGRSEFEGTGIGLSICKKIAENHGGFITAKSEKGKGSVFFVYLPKEPAAKLNNTLLHEHQQAG
ncbi:MAG TPA: ATP-binding protein, partial [Bacteroidia bacterium]|nr:ATP-binding protein [Bacteroidia bacterium]